MSKRNLINEIHSVKSRSFHNSRYDYMQRVFRIDGAIQDLEENNGRFKNELLRYIPISMVACFEAFFKSAVRDLVDFGSPFSENVKKFNQAQNIKLDFDVLGAMQAKSLTIGELIAHILPFNNLQDVNSNITTLIGKDFISELKKFKMKSRFESENAFRSDFVDRAGEIFQSVDRVYKIRHIFCHESPTSYKVDYDEVIQDYQNCKALLEQSNSLISEILYPGAPVTQTEMNIKSGERFEEIEKVLEELILEIKSKNFEEEPMLDFNHDLFDESMDRWREYRESHANYKADVVRGGTIQPLIYAQDMFHTTNQKIESLREEFELVLSNKRLYFFD